MESVDPVYLDPKIRDWVLFPIFVVMFMKDILNYYLRVLMSEKKKPDVDTTRKQQLLSRSRRLRKNHEYVTPSAFRMRKTWYTQKAFKAKTQEEIEREKQEATPPDPMAMMGQMKSGFAPQMIFIVTMTWVNYFFSGFVLVKLPFGLTDNFKVMVQRGILLKSLDASYVSSLSWYFLLMSGLRGLVSLVIGAGNFINSEMAMMDTQMQMAGAAAQPGQAPDFNKIYAGERTELDILKHDFKVSDAEYRLVGRTAPLRS